MLSNSRWSGPARDRLVAAGGYAWLAAGRTSLGRLGADGGDMVVRNECAESQTSLAFETRLSFEGPHNSSALRVGRKKTGVDRVHKDSMARRMKLSRGRLLRECRDSLLSLPRGRFGAPLGHELCRDA